LPVLSFADDEKLWPQKGDVVYVPGELHTQVLAFMSFDPKFHSLEPCKPLRVEKWKGREANKRLRVLDPASSTMSKIAYDLCGDWSAVFYRSYDECAEALRKSPAQIVTEGRCQQLVKPPETNPEPAVAPPSPQ